MHFPILSTAQPQMKSSKGFDIHYSYLSRPFLFCNNLEQGTFQVSGQGG